MVYKTCRYHENLEIKVKYQKVRYQENVEIQRDYQKRKYVKYQGSQKDGKVEYFSNKTLLYLHNMPLESVSLQYRTI